MKKNLFILFPGGFKPVHAGHIMLAENAYKTMSKDYDTEIYFIVSPKDRADIAAKSTVNFLNTICKKAPYMHVVETEECPSPIRYAYILTQAKVMGDGCYCMLASTKGADIKRARNFFRAFDNFGKYHTEGVEPILMENVSIPLEFTSRTDEFQYTPISSSVLRMDIANDDFESFFDGYRLLIEMRWIDDTDLIAYYNDLKASMGVSVEEGMAIQHLNEGGLGGHILHPYEIDDMTFEDLSELIKKLFCGDITDVTEKVDGMNLFASVDLDGEPIFARNTKHISEIPYRLKDLANPDLWRGGVTVSEAFRKGAEIITEVFKNIPSRVEFFNTVDSEGNLLERKWIDVEVMDPANTNVIPYDKVMVMFHMFLKAVECPDRTFLTEYNDSADLNYINSITEKIGNLNAKATPKVLLRKNDQGAIEALNYIADLNELRDDYDLPESATLIDYKKEAIMKYISNNFKGFSYEIMKALAERWAGEKNSLNMYWFRGKLDPSDYNYIREFEKNNLKQLQKKVIKPLESVFIRIGNNIISKAENLVNSGNEAQAVSVIKKQITDIIDLTDREGSEADKDKLEQLLIKLDQTGNIINATEGLVFRYKGRMMKLTGSFAIINQMNNIKYNHR